MGATAKVQDARAGERDEVFHRTRGQGADGASLGMTLVNLSVGGFMARSDAAFERGDRLRLTLPVLGPVGAEVRWALGGRIGCRLDQAIPSCSYDDVLSALGRSCADGRLPHATTPAYPDRSSATPASRSNR